MQYAGLWLADLHLAQARQPYDKKHTRWCWRALLWEARGSTSSPHNTLRHYHNHPTVSRCVILQPLACRQHARSVNTMLVYGVPYLQLGVVLDILVDVMVHTANSSIPARHRHRQ